MYLEVQLYLWWSLCTLKCSCTSGGIYVPWNAAVSLVEFMYLEVQLYLWWSLCTLKCSCTSGGVYVPWSAAVPLVEFMYLEVQLYLWWSLCNLKCSCTSGGVYVPWSAAVPLVEFMYLEVQLYLWWSLCTLKCSCTSGGVYVPWSAAVPLVEFMYLNIPPAVFKLYSHAWWELPRWLRSLLLCSCDVFPVLINSVIYWFCTGALGLILFETVNSSLPGVLCWVILSFCISSSLMCQTFFKLAWSLQGGESGSRKLVRQSM